MVKESTGQHIKWEIMTNGHKVKSKKNAERDKMLNRK
jgi:hypothetical protein